MVRALQFNSGENNMINFTEAAAEHVKTLMLEEPDTKGLQLFVQGGGCSGFSYGFMFMDEEVTEDFTVVETNGVNLFIDAMSVIYLADITVDYKNDINGSMFTVSNPSAITTCGCGSSFSV